MDVIVPKVLSSSTFSRASTASYYSSTGVLSLAAINVSRTNYDPANLSAIPTPLIESAATNNALSENFLFTNEVLASAVTYEYNCAISPDGKLGADKAVETTGNSVHGFQISPNGTETSGTATYSIFAKSAGRTAFQLTKGVSGEVWTFDLSAGTVVASGTGYTSVGKIFNAGNGWYRCSLTYTRDTSNGMNIFMLNGASSSYTGDGSSGIFFWGSQGEQQTASTSYIANPAVFTSRTSAVATYVSSTGLITTAAANVARMSYNPDNLSITPKLIIEPAATNLCLQSADLGTTWLSSNVTLTTNSTTSPAGTTTADTAADNSTGALGYSGQTVTIANNNEGYVFSAFVLKTTGATTFPGIWLGLTGGTAVTYAATLNTNTGVATAMVGGVPRYLRVDSYGTYWRVSVGGYNNTSGNTTANVRLYPSVNSDASGTWVVTTTGSGVFWGMQLEATNVSGTGIYLSNNLTRTSYIATTSASVTRGADVYSISTTTRAADVVGDGMYFSNIPENDYPAWSSATTYGVDVSGSNSVVYNHVKYASLQASNTNHQPDTSPTWWSVIGATNAYAMVDTQVGTQTVGSVGGHIVAYLKVGAQPSASFINVVADSITLSIWSAGSQVYTTTIDMTGGTSGVPVTDYTISGLPTYSDAIMMVDAYHATKAPAIGNFVVGTRYYVGSTETTPTIGITDYSIKTVDAFGNPTLTVRGYAKRMSTKQLLDDSEVDYVARIMSQVRATPCVWNANTTMVARDSNKKTSLIVYGYYKDWQIEVTYNTKSYLTAEIEGMI